MRIKRALEILVFLLCLAALGTWASMNPSSFEAEVIYEGF